MKRLAIILLALVALATIPAKAQSAREQLETISGSSIAATRASDDASARGLAARGWGAYSVESWKADRRTSWENRREARNWIRRERREARANRRRYHLKDYTPMKEKK